MPAPQGLRMQQPHSPGLHGCAELRHESCSDAVILRLRLGADGIEHGDRLLMSEFAAQDTGAGKPAHRSAPHEPDVNVIVGVRLRGSKSLFKKPAPRLPAV